MLQYTKDTSFVIFLKLHVEYLIGLEKICVELFGTRILSVELDRATCMTKTLASMYQKYKNTINTA